MCAQETDLSKKDAPKSEPSYEDTFSGPVVELSATKITVSRSILGRPAEKRTFLIKSDTRIEGRLRVRAKVTVGFVAKDDGDVQEEGDLERTRGIAELNAETVRILHMEALRALFVGLRSDATCLQVANN